MDKRDMHQEQFRFLIRGKEFTAPRLEPGLYLVSTPVGNLGDITIRALETLAGCSLIACEDTRTSGILLKRYGIDRPKISYTEHIAQKRGAEFLKQIEQGASIALISDAGTPLVSDPGYRLVRDAVERDLKVVPIPGASAPLAALVGSGMETSEFRFCGFLPSKAQARMQKLSSLKEDISTLIFFESPARLKATLAAMAESFGADRAIVVARELTKMYETFHRGSVSRVLCEFEEMDKIRGEIVIVVQPAQHVEPSLENVTPLLEEALKTLKTKQAVNQVAEQTGLSKQDLYSRALTLRKEMAQPDE